MKPKRTRTVSQKTSSARSKPTPSSLRPDPAPEPEAPVSPLNRPKTVWIVAAVLVGVVFICFADALWNGFVFDDHVHVLDNILVRSLTNLPSLVWDYRPLRDVSYAFDFAIFGDRPFGFHLTNILIHAANTVLVFLLIRRITDDLLVSCLSALLFAVHPIQTDSVAYISGRRDVLFTFFYLASFHAYLTYSKSRSWRYLVLFLGLWALSLGSKEMAASLPLVIFVWNFCQSWISEGPVLKRLWQTLKKAFLQDAWLYIVLSFAVIAFVIDQTVIRRASQRIGPEGIHFWGGSIFSDILTALTVNAWYIKQLVFPTPIAQYSGAFPISTSLADWRVVISIILLAGIAAAGFAMLSRNRLISFAIFSYFALLAPVSQIIPHHELLADHYLYLPMMSFGLLVALLARRIAAVGELPKRLTYAAAVLVLIVLAVMTVIQNLVWKDDFTLWQANYNRLPNSVRAAYSLAGQYVSRNPKKAEDLYRRCLDIDPAFGPPYVDLAVLLRSREKSRDLEALIGKGLATPDSTLQNVELEDPQYFRSMLTTALALAKDNEGDHSAAEQLLNQAITLDPFNQQPYEMLAAVYSGNQAKQVEILEREMAYIPRAATDVLIKLSTLMIQKQNLDGAIPYLERMLAANPNDVYANYQLGQIYFRKFDCARSGSYFARARSNATRPEDVRDVADAVSKFEKQCGKL
ncbi:MAG TPA: glycosyltransferase family 39 protein [Blastocatellia bacterium]|nr:glycosyltransferase family 39 protein [Blastocatellia bacterium]